MRNCERFQADATQFSAVLVFTVCVGGVFYAAAFVALAKHAKTMERSIKVALPRISEKS